VPAAVLGAKALLAVMLLVAGAAKLADLDSFAATVRLFLPRRRRPSAPDQRSAPDQPSAPDRPGRLTSPASARRIAWAVAAAELALGGASLALPAIWPLNLAVLGAAGCFAAVSGIGFAFHRDRSCRCFGALSRRRFDQGGLARSGAVAVVAGLATAPVAPAAVALAPAGHGLLLAGAALIAFVAFTAARSLAASRDALPGMVS
jgi:hypothetical protein